VPLGDAGRPFPQAVLEDKFRRLCESRLPPQQTEAIICHVDGLERLTTLTPLLDAMTVRRAGG
jgi:2-methylcitrate dehydratase PrpD